MLYLGMDLDREGADIPNIDTETCVHVDYFGFAVPVEPGATHIAADADGKLHCYWAEPIWYEGDCEWIMGCGSMRVRYCGEVDLEGVNWSETLMEIGK